MAATTARKATLGFFVLTNASTNKSPKYITNGSKNQKVHKIDSTNNKIEPNKKRAGKK